MEIEVKELKQQKALNDFRYFFEDILGYEKKLNLVAHKEILELLVEIDVCLKKGKGLERLLLLPRGFWKSTVFTVAGVNWLLTKYPDLRILISNANLSNAEKFLDEIKRNFKKDKYIELFGDQEGNVWRGGEIRVKSCKRSGKEMSITIGSPTTSLVSQHFDLIIGDDLVNRESVNTIEQIEKTKQYAKDLIPLGQGVKTIRIFIGTRWHFGDLYNWLIEDKHFPYILKSIYADKEETISSFVEEFPIFAINKLKEDLGSYDFACQYKNNPVDDEYATFKQKWIKRYREEELNKKQLLTFIAIDFALSKKEESDYDGVIVVSVDEYFNWYVRYAKRMKTNITEKVELIFGLWDIYKIQNIISIGVEIKAYEDMIRPLLLEKGEEKGIFPRVIPLKDGGVRKEDRIKGKLVGRLEFGKVYFKEDPKDDTNFLVDELLRFPKSKYDDLSDALAYIADIAHAPFGEMEEMPMTEQEERFKQKIGQTEGKLNINQYD